MLQAQSCETVTDHINKMGGFTAVKAILAVPGADFLFNTASLVILVPTDAAWIAAAKKLGASPLDPRALDSRPES